MKKIYKYPLKLQSVQSLSIPLVAVLSIQQQHGVWVLWAEVDTDKWSKTITVTTVGTGQVIPENVGQYISTIQEGSYVWHFYVKVG